LKNITSSEVRLILTIFKSPEKEYNANSIAKTVGLSSMGALKILKQLEKENILTSKEMGKAVFYKINFKSSYVRDYVKFLLKRESQQSKPYIRRWVTEVKKIKNADLAILFGSVLKQGGIAKDIDILLITKQDKFLELKKEIAELNKINDKKIHPVYQTVTDFEENIKNQDKIIINAIKGIIVFGEEKIIGVLENESR